MGGSTSTAASYSMQTLVDDVVAVLDESGTRTATVVGLSMGGGVAQELALTHPERVNGLVLVSTSPSFSQTTRQRFLAEAESVKRDGMMRWADIWLERWFSDEFRAMEPEVIAHERSLILAADPDTYYVRARINANRNFRDRISALAVPVMYIGGELDPMNCAAHIADYRLLLDQFSWELMKGASHTVQVEAAGRFNAALLAFLDRYEV